MTKKKKQDVNYLFSRYCNQLSTREEYLQFLALVAEGENDAKLKSLLTELWTELEVRDMPEAEVKSKSVLLWPQIAAAAAAILLVLFAVLFFNRQSVDPKKEVVQNKLIPHDIAPGGNKAYLTLNGGKRISLSNAANGLIAAQSGVQITKTADGRLIYTVTNEKADATGSGYNIIETPMGGQYQLHLPDGTKVWLNAASTLKYPASFSGQDYRRVELEGEAYFEVAKDKSHPFIVRSAMQDVEVLGTHFNISSYQNEPVIKTTLLEGSVRVNGIQRQNIAVLKPGQQSVIEGNRIDIRNVNTEQAIAWKNGKFVFGNENIESIMRRVARWYNVEVKYEGNISKEIFVGDVSRYENVSALLKVLQLTDQVHFKIEGRRIIVMP